MIPQYHLLSSHEVGASIEAIEAVGRCEKPVSEVEIGDCGQRSDLS